MARCRFVQPDTVRLSLSEGDWIDVKKELTAGEERRVFTNVVKTMHAGEKAELDPEQVGRTKIVEYVVAWSLIDQDGRPVPFTSAALDGVDPDTYGEISAAIDAHEERIQTLRAERKNGRSTSTESLAISG